MITSEKGTTKYSGNQENEGEDGNDNKKFRMREKQHPPMAYRMELKHMENNGKKEDYTKRRIREKRPPPLAYKPGNAGRMQSLGKARGAKQKTENYTPDPSIQLEAGRWITEDDHNSYEKTLDERKHKLTTAERKLIFAETHVIMTYNLGSTYLHL